MTYYRHEIPANHQECNLVFLSCKAQGLWQFKLHVRMCCFTGSLERDGGTPENGAIWFEEDPLGPPGLQVTPTPLVPQSHQRERSGEGQRPLAVVICIFPICPPHIAPRVYWENANYSPAPILWTPDAESQLTVKDPDAGKDWRQEEKGLAEEEMVGWHHRLNGHEFKQTLGDSEG